MKIHIKNMVCPRCVEAVKATLEELAIPYLDIQLGEVDLMHPVDKPQLHGLKKKLEEKGFALLEDKKDKIVEKVKNLLLDLIERTDDSKTLKLSEYLTKKIGYDYSHISGMFSESQGLTIERYMILQRIERAKEWLAYNELNLNEIADRLHYSSSAALSTQFKEVTGMTPTEFKKKGGVGRRSRDSVL